MLQSLLSLWGSKSKLWLGIAFALVLLGVLATASYYKNRSEVLTAQLTELRKQSALQAETAESLATRERERYEAKVNELAADAERSSSELERVRKQLSVAKNKLGATSSGECARIGGTAVDHLKRGVELATRCSQELSERREALSTCVRMYQDLESVYDQH